MKITIIYWRDIPSQIVAKAGRKTAKIMLDDRFQEAIDRAAMRDKAHETDAYLNGWRKSEPVEADGELQIAAEQKASQIDSQFNEETLAALVKNGGWEA